MDRAIAVFVPDLSWLDVAKGVLDAGYPWFNGFHHTSANEIVRATLTREFGLALNRLDSIDLFKLPFQLRDAIRRLKNSFLKVVSRLEWAAVISEGGEELIRRSELRLQERTIRYYTLALSVAEGLSERGESVEILLREAASQAESMGLRPIIDFDKACSELQAAYEVLKSPTISRQQCKLTDDESDELKRLLKLTVSAYSTIADEELPLYGLEDVLERNDGPLSPPKNQPKRLPLDTDAPIEVIFLQHGGYGTGVVDLRNCQHFPLDEPILLDPPEYLHTPATRAVVYNLRYRGFYLTPTGKWITGLDGGIQMYNYRGMYAEVDSEFVSEMFERLGLDPPPQVSPEPIATPPPSATPAKPTRAKASMVESNELVANYLKSNPDADSPEIERATGVPSGTVRNTQAWRNESKRRKERQSHSIAGIQHPLGIEAIAISEAPDPPTQAIENEENEIARMVSENVAYYESKHLDIMRPEDKASYFSSTPAARLATLIWMEKNKDAYRTA